MKTKQTMRGRFSRMCAVLLLTQCVYFSTAQANLIPTSWSINVAIHETGANGFTQDASDSSHTVQAPFANFSQSAVLGPSLSTAQYAFNIGQTVANYVVNVQHRCVNHMNGDYRANPSCESFGRIILTPSVDVLLTASINYSFVLPTDPVSVNLNVNASVADPFQALMTMNHFENTTLGGPHAGSYVNSDAVVLPAGRTATVQYSLRTSYSPTSAFGLLATGDGTVHLNMVTLPEPATLGPLALAALLVRKCNRSAGR